MLDPRNVEVLDFYVPWLNRPCLSQLTKAYPENTGISLENTKERQLNGVELLK